jgi:hypothetical protein
MDTPIESRWRRGDPSWSDVGVLLAEIDRLRDETRARLHVESTPSVVWVRGFAFYASPQAAMCGESPETWRKLDDGTYVKGPADDEDDPVIGHPQRIWSRRVLG